MKIIERFDRVNRAKRNLKVIHTLIKYGSKGAAKINPIVLAFDAAYSVIECSIEYFKYKKEKEKYKILVEELNYIKFQYQEKKIIIEESLKAYEVEIDLIANNFFDEVTKQREQLQKHNEIVLELKKGLVILKEFYIESNDLTKLKEINDLQVAFIELLIK